MQKVDISLQVMIVEDYLRGMKYKDIMSKYQINRWNIQDALSHFNIKTNRIKSYPRLPGSKKKNYTLVDEYAPVLRPVKRYHDIDLLPPIKVNKNNPVLNEDDLDYIERYNLETDDTGEQGSYEMAIDENGKVRCEENV